MKHPDKWRETTDIFTLPFQNITVLEVLGYPHAGNEVFHVKVMHQGSEKFAFVKVARQRGADIANEYSILSALPLSYSPEVLECSLSQPQLLVTKEAPGERLSYLVSMHPDIDLHAYLVKQAAMLSHFHRLEIACNPVKDRMVFRTPQQEFFDQIPLEYAREFLLSNTPKNPTRCFVHGDFHYANILWQDGKISCVLDYELSGIGIREFDLAWAIVLRPSQKFSGSWEDIEAFLSGYENDFCMASFCYYYVQIAVYFYTFPKGEETYYQALKRLMECAIAGYHTESLK